MPSRTAAVAALAAALSTAAATQDDASSLVQSAVQRHGAKKAKVLQDVCKCKTWADVYWKHGVGCGYGEELRFAGGAMSMGTLGGEFCGNFYTKLTKSSFCTQRSFSMQETEQWCYVDIDCEELNGGSFVSSEVSWKVCKESEDSMLLSYTPEQLLNVSQSENKDAGLLLKMAYPVFEGEDENGVVIKWPKARDFFLFGKDTDKPWAKLLQKIKDSGKPMVFDSLDSHPPFAVVVGEKVYQSDFTPWFHEMQARGEDVFKNPKFMNQYTCLKGCDSLEVKPGQL